MEIRDLTQFLKAIQTLLMIMDNAGPVLFRIRFRFNYSESLPEVLEQLQTVVDSEYIQYPEQFEEMNRAGLSGQQLRTKLESFEFSFNRFDEEGGVENLEEALGKGGTILGSLAGAIPGFGSFAQELVDFILKELKRRFGRSIFGGDA